MRLESQSRDQRDDNLQAQIDGFKMSVWTSALSYTSSRLKETKDVFQIFRKLKSLEAHILSSNLD